MKILGIDPGGRTTGLAVQGHNAIAHATVVNPGVVLPPPREYLQAVIKAALALADDQNVDLIAVESVRRPNWHAGGAAANPTGLLGTMGVYGAALAYDWPVPVVAVPPLRNGSKPLGSYPEHLVSDGERRKSGWQLRVGSGQLRHARSAWDVALAARMARAK